MDHSQAENHATLIHVSDSHVSDQPTQPTPGPQPTQPSSQDLSDPAPDLDEIRTEALGKLGRNIVNFSKIEAILKILLSIHQQEAGDRKKSGKKAVYHLSQHNSPTLGRLVHDFNRNFLRKPKDIPDDIESYGEGISTLIAHGDIKLSKSKRKKLAKVVAERNQLLHHDLASLDTDSAEDCLKLIQLLDEQNPRLLAHLAELELIYNNVKAMYQQITAQLLESTEFDQWIQDQQTE